jgi:hypothetical protein
MKPMAKGQTTPKRAGLSYIALGYLRSVHSLTILDAVGREWLFAIRLRPLGFAGYSKGIMTFSGTQWLGITPLTMLIVINGIATGCNLVADRRQAQSARIGGLRAVEKRMVANA